MLITIQSCKSRNTRIYKIKNFLNIPNMHINMHMMRLSFKDDMKFTTNVQVLSL